MVGSHPSLSQPVKMGKWVLPIRASMGDSHSHKVPQWVTVTAPGETPFSKLCATPIRSWDSHFMRMELGLHLHADPGRLPSGPDGKRIPSIFRGVPPPHLIR